jgi:hypothetical protein
MTSSTISAKIPQDQRDRLDAIAAAEDEPNFEGPIALRWCKADGTSPLGDNSFCWNLEIGGITTAPDWDPSMTLTNGLFGYLNAEGSGDCLPMWDFKNQNYLWLIVRPIGEIIDFSVETGGECKFQSAETLFVGDRDDALRWLDARFPNRPVIGRRTIVGRNAEAISGGHGVSIAGTFANAISGRHGVSVAGIGGAAVTGSNAVAVAGPEGRAMSWEDGISVSRENGTSETGVNGISVSDACGLGFSGSGGISIAGKSGISIAGDGGLAISGFCGVAAAGRGGYILLKYWDYLGRRYSYRVGEIGKDGLKAYTSYELNAHGEFVQAKNQALQNKYYELDRLRTENDSFKLPSSLPPW